MFLVVQSAAAIGYQTDALIITIFMRDLSAEYRIRTTIRDEDHPLLKLRRLDFDAGRLPGGQSSRH